MFKLFRFFDDAPRQARAANVEALVALFRMPIEDELCARPVSAFAGTERVRSPIPATQPRRLVRVRP